MRGKVTVEKRLKRAGATRLFWLPAAQKVLGVAPALDAIADDPFFHGDEDSDEQHRLQGNRI